MPSEEDREIYRLLIESEQCIFRDQLRQAHAEAKELYKDVGIHPDIEEARRQKVVLEIYEKKMNILREEVRSTITRDTDHSDQ